jgi:hypothetical protein
MPNIPNVGAVVMPGPVPGIHVFLACYKTWMAGTSPAITSGEVEQTDDALRQAK